MKWCWHKEEKSRTVWAVALLKIFGGTYLAKAISRVFWIADICSYGCEDHLLHLHVAAQMHCCLTGICHFECKGAVSRQRYRSLPLPGKAEPLKEAGHLCEHGQRDPKSRKVHASLVTRTVLSHRGSAFRVFLQTCLLCKCVFQRICWNGVMPHRRLHLNTI